MATRYLITGATGFVGGHIAEACVGRGYSVATIARLTSDVSLLEKWGVTIHRGELGDSAVVKKAIEDVDVVIHCAAKVGDWGPVEEYRPVNVDALRVLLEACKGRALSRFVQISSLAVYEARHHYGTDETTPPGTRHNDAYSTTKAESEKLALDYQRTYGVPVVVLRPGFVYGPRDRTVLPPLVDGLRAGKIRYLGAKGARAMNSIFVRNLVDAVFLAIENPNAVGQVYNLTDDEKVSKRRFMESIADAVNAPRPTRSVPLWLARLATWIMERRARRRGSKESPLLNYPRLKFLGLNLDFSVEKAKRELGYKPRFSFEQGMKETMDWYRQTGASAASV